MVKKIVLGFVLLLLAMQIVLAIDTEITVKTLPNNEVQLTTFEPDTTSFIVYERFKGTSDDNGKISFTFSSTKPVFNVVIFVKQDGTTVLTERYEESYTAGTSFTIELYPSWYTPPIEEINDTGVNETEEIVVDDVELNDTPILINETEEVQEESNDESDIDIGSFLKSFTSKKVLYYTAGGVIALFVVIIVILLITKLLLDVRRGLREDKSSSGGDVSGKKKSIEEAKEKIRKTKEEKQSIIDKAKRDMDETKKELKDLMGIKKKK